MTGRQERTTLVAPDEKIQPLHPPDWLIGTWQGSPHSARMEVDELGVAICLADTTEIIPRDHRTSLLRAEWLIHANATQVASESTAGDGRTYRLRLHSGTCYSTNLETDESVRVCVDEQKLNFPARKPIPPSGATVAVMGMAEKPQIGRIGAAAEPVGQDVVDLQQMP